MKGLEQAKEFYLSYGAEMIHSKFPQYEDKIAVGLAGPGSECFGFDDEISRDHDFETGFCMWITDSTDLEVGIELARAYRQLPVAKAQSKSALGQGNTGVRRTKFFYRRYTGSDGAPESWQQWLYLPTHALAEATNGQVWRDDLGQFSKIRETILKGMPEDVRKKKLAARAVEMAQSGQYNYSRCLKHGQSGSAMLALTEFVKAAAQMCFLLNRRHMPYYKWMLPAMARLPVQGQLAEALEFLLTGENDAESQSLKAGVIEDVCHRLQQELQRQGLCGAGHSYMEQTAFEINSGIENPEIRSLHIMEG